MSLTNHRSGRVLGKTPARRSVKSVSTVPISSSPLATSPASVSSIASSLAPHVTTVNTNTLAPSHPTHSASSSISSTNLLHPSAALSSSPSHVNSPPVSITSAGSSTSLTSNISNDESPTRSEILCPICGESMVTLLQLNRHIDDIHSDIEQKDEDFLKSWFKKKVEQAKQLHTVTSVFNNRFSKLDLGDGFDDLNGSADSTQPISTTSSLGNALKEGTNGHRASFSQQLSTPKILPTKDHWQKPSTLDKCSDVVCEKTLNTRNGIVNCRKCGKLFCSEHTRYQMKLNVKAEHDPVNGAWSRCCETCFKSMPGYFDSSGSINDVSSAFFAARRKKTDIHDLEVNKLEKRLIKLIGLLTDPKFTSNNDGGSVLSYSKANLRRDAEKRIIKWEPDSSVTDCPICENTFGYTLRKHHCRLCGRVVCASLATNCSREVPISMLVDKLDDDAVDLILSSHRNMGNSKSVGSNGHSRKALDSRGQVVNKNGDMNLRICKDCKNTLFSRQNFMLDMADDKKPPIISAYERLIPIRKSIDLILPKFQHIMAEINKEPVLNASGEELEEDEKETEEMLVEAGKMRRRLMEAFFELDKAAKRLQNIKTSSEEEARVKKLVVIDIAQYLQVNMIPLRALPKVLKKDRKEKNGKKGTKDDGAVNEVEEAGFEAEVEGEGDDLSDREVSELQQQLIVLEEQKFLVDGMVKEASSKRRFDELKPLQQSIEDLEKEISHIKTRLGKRNQMM